MRDENLVQNAQDWAEGGPTIKTLKGLMFFGFFIPPPQILFFILKQMQQSRIEENSNILIFILYSVIVTLVTVKVT